MNKVLKFEENFLNSSQKYYWAGFIAADGCIVNAPSRYLSIHLHSCDIDHLKKLQNIIRWINR